MKITIYAFSSVRTACGFSEKEIEAEKGSSVSDVMERLFSEYKEFSKMKGRLLFAINEEYSDENRTLHENDNLAIFPPVSGG